MSFEFVNSAQLRIPHEILCAATVASEEWKLVWI